MDNTRLDQHGRIPCICDKQCSGAGVLLGQAYLRDHSGIQDSLDQGWEDACPQHGAVVLEVRRQGAEHAHCALFVCCVGAA